MEKTFTNKDGLTSSKKVKKNVAKNFVFTPIKSGIVGFATFFSILLLTKLAAYLIGSESTFTVEIDDVVFCGTGKNKNRKDERYSNFFHNEGFS
jgi:hypothetical protein